MCADRGVYTRRPPCCRKGFKRRVGRPIGGGTGRERGREIHREEWGGPEPFVVRMNEETVKSTAEQRSTGGNPVSEGTLRTLGELEQHFERIKKLHAQTAQRESDLEQLASEVDRRTREIESRAAELEGK